MSKKKLDLNELIKNKDKLSKKKSKMKDIYVEQLDAVITVQAPDRSLILESFEMGEGVADDFLIYNTIVEPNLKDSELQKIYECVEPIEIVSKIFDIGSIRGIAEQVLSMAGFNSKVTAVDELKN